MYYAFLNIWLLSFNSNSYNDFSDENVLFSIYKNNKKIKF